MSLVRPGHLTWSEWSNTILIDYPFATVPYPEPYWKEWVDYVVGNRVFGNAAVPTSQVYSNWRDWAEATVGAVG